MQTLEWLNFSRNELTGSLSETVSKLKTLKLLDLVRAALCSPIFCVCTLIIWVGATTRCRACCLCRHGRRPLLPLLGS